MSKRPDYVHCVGHAHIDLKNQSWCGKNIANQFNFVDAAHAAEHRRKKERLLVCPECREKIIEALNNEE